MDVGQLDDVADKAVRGVFLRVGVKTKDGSLFQSWRYLFIDAEGEDGMLIERRCRLVLVTLRCLALLRVSLSWAVTDLAA